MLISNDMFFQGYAREICRTNFMKTFYKIYYSDILFIAHTLVKIAIILF